jgi:glutathione S-transferase
MPALRLYDYAASANAYKVRLLIAQLGLDVERVEVDIFAGATLTDDFADINPARTVPVLELPSTATPTSRTRRACRWTTSEPSTRG